MGGLTTQVYFEVSNWPEATQTYAIKAVETALEELGLQAIDASLAITLTNDAHQQELNAKWRQKDKSTNVLSFPQTASFMPLKGLLGDITLAHETVVREAGELGLVFDHHVAHLVVHGFLHIVGYDHQDDQSAQKMEDLERRILARLGIDDPYRAIKDKP